MDLAAFACVLMVVWVIKRGLVEFVCTHFFVMGETVFGRFSFTPVTCT